MALLIQRLPSLKSLRSTRPHDHLYSRPPRLPSHYSDLLSHLIRNWWRRQRCNHSAAFSLVKPATPLTPQTRWAGHAHTYDIVFRYAQIDLIMPTQRTPSTSRNCQISRASTQEVGTTAIYLSLTHISLNSLPRRGGQGSRPQARGNYELQHVQPVPIYGTSISSSWTRTGSLAPMHNLLTSKRKAI